MKIHENRSKKVMTFMFTWKPDKNMKIISCFTVKAPENMKWYAVYMPRFCLQLNQKAICRGISNVVFRRGQMAKTWKAKYTPKHESPICRSSPRAPWHKSPFLVNVKVRALTRDMSPTRLFSWFWLKSLFVFLFSCFFMFSELFMRLGRLAYLF